MLYWDILGFLVVALLTKGSNSFLGWDIIGLLLSSSRPRDQIPFLGRDIIRLLIFLAFWLSFSRLRDQTPFLGRDIIRLLLSSSRPRDRIPFLCWDIIGLQLLSPTGTLLDFCCHPPDQGIEFLSSVGTLLDFRYSWLSDYYPPVSDWAPLPGWDIIGLLVKDLKSLSIDLLVPGMLVNAQVTSVLENGIMLSFLIHTSLDITNTFSLSMKILLVTKRPAIAAIVSECLVASSFETVRGWDSFKSLLSPSGHMSFWFRPFVHTRVGGPFSSRSSNISGLHGSQQLYSLFGDSRRHYSALHGVLVAGIRCKASM
ncbi:hypothetical protein ZIOFF_018472 [Zingiber officinale]|uniref:Uncharacterized protein n=1 Tax=Zingiber officinale TaxID=94328 RepID=A0A8J5LIS9_ZINOF|nr:hypothetical protein ZIOFF_018472 [Zingiber officinale]